VGDETCKGQVWRGWQYYPCRKKATRDGYCRWCNPAMQAERKSKQAEAFKARIKAEADGHARDRRIATAERAVIQAAEAWLDAPERDDDTEIALMGAIQDLREARK
jgi:hypothetical protein